ncbi:MAG: APC family permease [Candidatus Ancillula sp.]|nr:APC family permease [Candidatus Ancillula sp.]
MKNSEDTERELDKRSALAMLSSDALSSVAYGTEQIVLVLVAVSSAAIWWSIPIACGVLILLTALILSYRQIIRAYPHGGGAYVVSSENLGKNAGLIAGGSLLIDYMLTVAVSVSAGAEAIGSAIPFFVEHQLMISSIIIVILCLLNLRGVRESANALMVPVYLFIFIMTFVIIIGVVKILIGAAPFHATAVVGQAIPAVSIALILRAFSSGAASLTGVEAISNAVPIFKEPKPKNAGATLALMGVILGFFFSGVTFLNYWYGITPEPKVTVLSQVAAAVLGGTGVLYYVFQFSTAAILAVAANTGFSAFPVLGYNLAKDKYMPHIYKDKGARLGYSGGIFTLAVGAWLLIILFKGDTSRLIPLYSVGVFIPFTLSQTGMIVRWAKMKTKKVAEVIPNVVGALISLAIVLILFAFRIEDVWPFFFIMPAILYMFTRIKKHYDEIARQLRLTPKKKHGAYKGNQVVVLVGHVTVSDLGAIDYARSIAHNENDEIIAVHVDTGKSPEKDVEIHEEFHKHFPDIDFRTILSPDRSVTEPVVNYIRKIAREAKKREYATTVVISQFVPKHPWERLLHNQTAMKIKIGLSSSENIVVSTSSYHLKK